MNGDGIAGFIFLMMLITFVIFGIRSCNQIEEEHGKNNIVAVWKHEANHYSVTVKEGSELIDRTLMREGGIDCKIITDVPKGVDMWYKYDFKKSGWKTYYNTAEIHIHSVSDINGAGWNHGKFGSGETERAQ